MIRNLWLIITNDHVFKEIPIWTVTIFNLRPIVKCLKIGCLLSLFQKKNWKENVKMLLQNNCTNEDVTNDLKERKKVHKTTLYG